MSWPGKSIISTAVIVVCALAVTAPAGTVILTPIKDNTLFSTGTTSNGAGDAVFSGRTGTGISQRAVLAFDVAGNVPAGSVIVNVCLKLHLLMSGPTGAHTHALYRVLDDWGEGTSSAFGGMGAPATPGDATWLHTFFPAMFWAAPGGDFDPTMKADQLVGMATIDYTWGSTPAMVGDVQDWLDNPATSFGWLLRGNESTGFTAKKFGSKENTVPAFRPTLTVNFAPPPPRVADIDDDGTVGPSDLAAVLGAWGPCPCCREDLNGDGVVDAFDLALLLGDWGP